MNAILKLYYRMLAEPGHSSISESNYRIASTAFELYRKGITHYNKHAQTISFISFLFSALGHLHKVS